MLFLLLLILPGVRVQESTPSGLNRHFKHHPFHAVQFVPPKPTKNGPILFPNDAPPPPPTPLIVTSRPLSESIAKSDLNLNNSHTAQSQLNHVSFKPEYLARGKNYRPFSYTLATVAPLYDLESAPEAYDVVKKVQGGRKDSYYTDFEGSNGRKNRRKSFFSEDEKSLDLRVRHGSLYSREADENDDHHSRKRAHRRANYDDVKSRMRPFHEIDSRSDSHYRSRKKRPYQNMNRNRRPFQRPNRVSNEDRQLERRPFQKSTSPRDYYNRHRKPSRYKDSLSDVDDRKIDARVHRKTKYLSDEDNRNRKRKPFKEPESLIDAKKGNGRPIYKTEDTKNKPSYNSNRLSNYDIISSERRPTHKVEDQTRTVHRPMVSDKKNKENKPSHRAGVINKSKDFSEEEIQHRAIRPLYALTESYNRVEQTTHKPYRYKSQEKSPDYSNYFYSNEGDNDDSKHDNHGENYAFSYTVKDHKTGDDFSHSQHSRGSATNGEYRVRLPDGRMQIVSYTADENGYKADVRYDERHHHDNSIDLDISRENAHHKQPPIHFKNNYALDHFDSQDFSVNQDYIDHHYKNDRLNEHPSQPHRRPTVARDQYQHDGYTNHHIYDRIGHGNDHAAHAKEHNIGPSYDITGHKKGEDHKDGSITDSNNDYLEHYKDKKYNKLRAQDTDYFLFSDEIGSKEIVDYSSELNGGYRPHTSKFSTYTVKSTVKPSYDEIKDILVTSLARRNNAEIPIASTAKPNYEVTTEKVVLIGAKNPNLYTNIRDAASVTPSPLSYTTPFASTPSGYLFSTIANLKNQVNLVSKPVLSNRYIDKINKYLSY